MRGSSSSRPAPTWCSRTPAAASTRTSARSWWRSCSPGCGTESWGCGRCSARLEALDIVPDQPITTVISSNSTRDVTYAAMACRDHCLGAAHRGARVLLVQSGDEAIVDEIADLIRDGGADPGPRHRPVSHRRRRPAPRAGRGDERPPARAGPARGRAGRPPASRWGPTGSCSTSSSPTCCARFATPCSAPSSAGTRSTTHELLETLAAFLANDGHWRQTAAQLHIHHNTLHYRLQRGGAPHRAADRVGDEPGRSGPGARDPARARRRSAPP